MLKSLFIRLVMAFFIAATLVLGSVVPTFAGGLTVYGAKIDSVVTAGNSYSYTMKVENSSDAEMQISVEIKGYGTSDGSDFVVLNSTDDTSPLSAAAFLSVSPSSFALSPASSTEVTVSATVPRQYSEAGAYAIVFIHTAATDGSVSTVSGVAARVLLNVEGLSRVHNSTIQSATITQDHSAIMVTVENNGNHHYKPHVRTELIYEGSTVGEALLDADWPLIPGYERQLAVNLSNLTFPAGDYEARIEVMDDDNNVVAESSYDIGFLDASNPPIIQPSAMPTSEDSSLSVTPVAENPIVTEVASNSNGSGLASMIALIAGAFVLGSAGTLLASKRRRVRR